MIAAIQGEVFQVSTDSVIVMTSGVGYELFCTPSTLVQFRKGESAQLLVYTHVTEDSLVLFGFLNSIEKQMYLSLLKVNGIGAKTALNILSGASVDELLAMVERGDVKALSKLPKVGKKTAEQMILTLKGKLVLTDSEAKIPKAKKQHSEISFALVNLGFRSQDVEKVIGQLPVDIDTEEGIRQGLSVLTKV